MTAEIHPFMQYAKDFHISLRITAKEDDMAIARMRFQPRAEVAAIAAQATPPGERGKHIVKFSQIARRFVLSPIFD
ncbi:MAG: hypothetical protein M9924_02115 [Rhizobiaceae bacterium]|nr:hypothetical protein [Rhizobiaceae bacterium]